MSCGKENYHYEFPLLFFDWLTLTLNFMGLSPRFPFTISQYSTPLLINFWVGKFEVPPKIYNFVLNDVVSVKFKLEEFPDESLMVGSFNLYR